MQQTAVNEWFKQCFAILPSTVRVHALGTTVASMLRRFPFDSVDSTSWINAAANGNVLVPVFDSKGPDFRHSPHTIAVSDRSTWRNKHFNNLDIRLQQQAAAFFEECGTSLAELRICKVARRRVNIRYYQGLAEVAKVKIFFVSGLNDYSLVEALRHCGVRSHLLSFAELKDNLVGMIKYVWRKW